MSKIDYQHIMQYQRQVEEGEVIYQPDPNDDNGYFLEHGVVYLIDNESLITKASKKNAACVLTGPVILNAPNLILKVPLGCWAVAGQKCKIYIFEANIFTNRFKTEDRFLTAVTDYTLQRIEKAKENLGFRGAE